MLNIKGLSDSGGANGGSPGAVISYLQNTEQGHVGRDGAYYSTGYYSTGAPSQWHGTLATEMGLTGEIKTADLECMLSGETPAGETFGAERAGNRRMGNDMTISAPKSISIQALAAGDETVIAAHDRAVGKAIEYIESNIVSARYGRNGIYSDKTHSMAAAVYRHEDARPVDGVVDPSLHSHVIAINVTRDSHGNLRSTDLDFGDRNIRMETADAIYKAALAQELEAAGYQTRRTQNGFELADITDEQIQSFSKRTSQIEASDEYLNASTTGQRKSATLHTREGKGNDSRDELRSKWRDAAETAGVDATPHESGTAALDTEDAISADVEYPESESVSAEDQAINDALEHLDERDAVNNVEQIYYHALRYGMGQVDPDTVKARIDEREDLHQTAAGIVSDSTLIREDSVMAAIEQGRGSQDPISNTDAAKQDVTAAEDSLGIEYTRDQRRAAVNALSSTDQITGIVGAAGSGKTTVMKTIADNARERGYEIVGLAPSAAAAAELEGAGADSTGTLASHNLRGKPESDSGPRYYIVDEAAMVSTRDMQAFVNTLRSEDRVLLSGDPRQIQAVEAGAPYAQAIKEGAVSVSRMTEIRRQSDPQLREIAEGFAEGRAAGATNRVIRDYTETVEVTEGSGARGKPVAADKRSAIAERAAAAFLEKTPDQQSDTLVLAGNNDVRQQINERVREGLIAEGRVDADSQVNVPTVEKTNLTAAQRRDVTSYQPGLVVRDRTGDNDVTGHDAVNNTVNLNNRATGEDRSVSVDSLSDKGTRIYQASERQIGAGDQVVITENDKSNGIRNGDRLTVDAVDAEQGTINATRMGDGKQVELDANRAQALDHGYAMTVHKSQGSTAESVIVAGVSSRVATAEQAYVACSRERSSLEVITDNPEQLRQTWQRWNENQTARAAMAETEQQSTGGENASTDRAELRAAAVARAAIERAQQESRDTEQESEQGGASGEGRGEDARVTKTAETDRSGGRESVDGQGKRAGQAVDNQGQEETEGQGDEGQGDVHQAQDQSIEADEAGALDQTTDNIEPSVLAPARARGREGQQEQEETVEPVSFFYGADEESPMYTTIDDMPEQEDEQEDEQDAYIREIEDQEQGQESQTETDENLDQGAETKHREQESGQEVEQDEVMDPMSSPSEQRPRRERDGNMDMGM